MVYLANIRNGLCEVFFVSSKIWKGNIAVQTIVLFEFFCGCVSLVAHNICVRPVGFICYMVSLCFCLRE